jgi:hypothetical protein
MPRDLVPLPAPAPAPAPVQGSSPGALFSPVRLRQLARCALSRSQSSPLIQSQPQSRGQGRDHGLGTHPYDRPRKDNRHGERQRSPADESAAANDHDSSPLHDGAEDEYDENEVAGEDYEGDWLDSLNHPHDTTSGSAATGDPRPERRIRPASRRNVSRACEQCRSRKSKCSGGYTLRSADSDRTQEGHHVHCARVLRRSASTRGWRTGG